MDDWLRRMRSNHYSEKPTQVENNTTTIILLIYIQLEYNIYSQYKYFLAYSIIVIVLQISQTKQGCL